MTKKKIVIVPKDVPVEPPPAPEPEPTKPANPHYTMSLWAGVPKYQCNYCAWDTVEGEREILEHLYQRHLGPAATLPPKQSLILTADKSGREVKGI